MRGLLRPTAAAALIACCGLTALAAAVPAAGQGSYSPYNETAASALSRYLRDLASDPKDFTTLIGAGRAALELGDAQAAAGFFARADAVNPHSPLPQAGMGAVSVINGDPQAALPYFVRAQELGATLVTIGCDRGLAYDLLGNQAAAQADYRAALKGPDGDEARRRLALSLAISGNRTEALQTLAPLSAKGDPAVSRARAFVLALSGDSAGAMGTINAAMPGSSASMAPFLQRLPALMPGQKAAAVNLGIFPDSSPAGRYANASLPQPQVPAPVVTGSVTTDRLAGIDQLLHQPQQLPRQQTVAYTAPVQRTNAAAVQHATAAQRQSAAKRKIWLQLASGSDAAALPREFRTIKSRHEDLFDGIPGYIAKSGGRARLVVGPFRSASDADIFAEDLQTVDIRAFKWTNSPADQIVPLATE